VDATALHPALVAWVWFLLLRFLGKIWKLHCIPAAKVVWAGRLGGECNQLRDAFLYAVYYGGMSISIFIILLCCRDGKPSDTAESAGHPLPLVEASLVEGGVVSCTEDARRESPLQLSDMGEGWTGQDPAGWSHPEGSWTGSEGIAVGDFDGNGLLDVFRPTVDRNLLFLQQEGGTMAEEGLDHLPDDSYGTSVGASAADYDGDGDLDLFLLNADRPNALLQNQGDGSFLDASEEAGLIQDHLYSPGASWGDPDGDGDLDLLVLALGAGPQGPPPWTGDSDFVEAGSNTFYVNNGDGTFAVADLPGHDPEPYSCCAAFIDIDGDFVQDLYIVNDFGAWVQPNLVYLNSGNLALSQGSGLDIAMFGMGMGIGDLNGDGFPDFVVTDWNRNALLLSDGAGGWIESAAAHGLVASREGQHIAWGAEMIDADNDGDLDIWIPYGQLDIPSDVQGDFDEAGLYNPRHQPDALFLQGEDGFFSDAAAGWGIDRSTVSRGGSWADLNQDGFLDLLSPAVDGPLEAFLSECDDSAWLKVSLRMPSPNTRAIGAVAEVVAGGRTQRRWMLAGATSVSSGGPPELHFGLGQTDRIDALRIIWPDQTISEFTDIQTRQSILVEK
jgi:hypothetical protein